MLAGGAEAPAVLILPYRLNDPVNDLFHALLLIRGSRNMRGRLVEVFGLFRLGFPPFLAIYMGFAVFGSPFGSPGWSYYRSYCVQ